MKSFHYSELIERIKKEIRIDFYGIHGIGHWERVYHNTQLLSEHYGIESKVFELFALLHDSKRHNEHRDPEHGKRAAEFAALLMKEGAIELSDEESGRLLYACANHTHHDKSDPLFYDRIVEICFDSDRLDIGRVGIVVDPERMATGYARALAEKL